MSKKKQHSSLPHKVNPLLTAEPSDEQYMNTLGTVLGVSLEGVHPNSNWSAINDPNIFTGSKFSKILPNKDFVEKVKTSRFSDPAKA